MKRVKTPEGWTEYAIDEKKPVAAASKGIWNLTLAQYFLTYASLSNERPTDTIISNLPADYNDWVLPLEFRYGLSG
jgi:hypothetical protein